MKKIVGVVGIALFLMIPVVVTPVVGTTIEEDNFNDVEIKWKLLLVIGRINVCFDESVISGFALVGYTAGEILVVERININFEGIPLFINNGLFFSFCFYKPADNST